MMMQDNQKNKRRTFFNQTPVCDAILTHRKSYTPATIQNKNFSKWFKHENHKKINQKKIMKKTINSPAIEWNKWLTQTGKYPHRKYNLKSGINRAAFNCYENLLANDDRARRRVPESGGKGTLWVAHARFNRPLHSPPPRVCRPRHTPREKLNGD